MGAEEGKAGASSSLRLRTAGADGRPFDLLLVAAVPPRMHLPGAGELDWQAAETAIAAFAVEEGRPGRLDRVRIFQPLLDVSSFPPAKGGVLMTIEENPGEPDTALLLALADGRSLLLDLYLKACTHSYPLAGRRWSDLSPAEQQEAAWRAQTAGASRPTLLGPDESGDVMRAGISWPVRSGVLHVCSQDVEKGPAGLPAAWLEAGLPAGDSPGARAVYVLAFDPDSPVREYNIQPLPPQAKYDSELGALAWTDAEGRSWYWDMEARSVNEIETEKEALGLDRLNRYDYDYLSRYVAGINGMAPVHCQE